MYATKRRFEPAVIERLFEEPYRFEYFQAVRMLELWLKRHGTAQQGLVANFLRFQNSIMQRRPCVRPVRSLSLSFIRQPSKKD